MSFVVILVCIYVCMYFYYSSFVFFEFPSVHAVDLSMGTELLPPYKVIVL